MSAGGRHRVRWFFGAREPERISEPGLPVQWRSGRPRFFVATATAAVRKGLNNKVIDTSYLPGDERGRVAAFDSRQEAEEFANELNRRGKGSVTLNH